MKLSAAIECPHCGRNNCLSLEIGNTNASYDTQCWSCKKTFIVRRNVEISNNSLSVKFYAPKVEETVIAG